MTRYLPPPPRSAAHAAPGAHCIQLPRGAGPGAERVYVRTQDAMSRTVPHLSVWICKISPCHTMLAYAVDTTGDERYTGRPHRAPRGPRGR